MATPVLSMALAGTANLVPALLGLFTALLGSNGLDSARGGRLLGALAMVLLLGWVASLFLARHLARGAVARGWSTIASVAAAGGGAVAAYLALATVATFVALLWVGA